MRNIKLVLEYDGSLFFGFQRQPKHLTVQEVLENALSKFFNSGMKITSASGRTDTGVHALRQVVNFKTASGRPVAAIQKALNALLPRAIAVAEVSEVPADFHARFSAKSKTYEYRIWNHAVRSPLRGVHACHISFPLDVAKMRKAAKFLEGKHDFRSFCASDPSKKRENTVRTIKRLEISKKNSLVCITVSADGFLYHMVRNIAGLLIDAGSGKLDPVAVKAVLEAHDRRAAGKTAPAEGLALIDVNY